MQPILDVFEREGVRFGLEVHPTEIAYDFVTTQKTLAALGNRESFGINLDPSHFIPQFLDPALFAREFARPHLPRARQGREAPSRRAPLDPRLASPLRRSRPRLGLRLARARRRRLRGALPDAERDRLRRPAVGRVGRQRHGSRAWRRRGRAPSSAGARSRRRPSPSTTQCSGTENREEPAAVAGPVADSPGRCERPGRQAGCSSRSADNSRGARAFIRRPAR